MKRYGIWAVGDNVHREIREEQDGEWVQASDAEAEIEKARREGIREGLADWERHVETARAEKRRIVQDLEDWLRANPAGAYWRMIDHIRGKPPEPKPLERLVKYDEGEPWEITEKDVDKINALVDAVNELRAKK